MEVEMGIQIHRGTLATILEFFQIALYVWQIGDMMAEA
jgi:hypothetical protein